MTPRMLYPDSPTMLSKENVFPLDDSKEGSVEHFLNRSCCLNPLVQNILLYRHRDFPYMAFLTNKRGKSRTVLTWDCGYDTGKCLTGKSSASMG